VTRRLRRLVATTDFHSAFDGARPMLAHLHSVRPDSLVVDCGDFFEGSGYYRLAHGSIERTTLLALYDVIAPGNHGWTHHFDPDLHRITVCANATDTIGRPLFRRLHLSLIGGRRVGVTGIIGLQAFNAIPVVQRVGHRVTDPVTALREVMLAHHHEADAWIVLSHSGFDEDLKLAAACPFLDVIFAGHCHSDRHGPVPIDNTLVIKAHELGVGYASAEPAREGWAAGTHRFTAHTPAPLPTPLAPLAEHLDAISAQLSEPLGILTAPYSNELLDRRALLTDLAQRLRTGLGADAVVLNETALRSIRLTGTLTTGDLLAIEPFDNHLVHAHLPAALRENPAALLAHLTHHAGPIVTAPTPLPQRSSTVLTTDYLADGYLDGRTRQAGLHLGQAIAHTLTEGTKP
jgi:5'-nucleotidase/UDP-sugar diphosphatase